MFSYMKFRLTELKKDNESFNFLTSCAKISYSHNFNSKNLQHYGEACLLETADSRMVLQTRKSGVTRIKIYASVWKGNSLQRKIFRSHAVPL